MKKIAIHRYLLLLLIFISSLLSACGFHLQGEMQLVPPLRKMYLSSPDPYSVLKRALQQALKLSGVQLVNSPQEATTVLAILQDSTSQHLLSVNGTQQTSQFKLVVSVIFELTDSKGKTILPPQTLSDSRVITVQSNQILGSSNEANLYFQQMRSSLAHAIMYRIASRQVSRNVIEAFSPPHTGKKIK